MQMDVRYLIVTLSVTLILGGLYFKFLYDVPDGQELTNMWVSWALVILGIGGIISVSLWKKRNPLFVGEEDNLTDDDNDENVVGVSDFNKINTRGAEHKRKNRKNDDDDYYADRSKDT